MRTSQSLNACHVRWAKPRAQRGTQAFRSKQLELDSKEQVLPDLEILTTIASIASWKKWMGQITLYCDHESKRFFDRLGMLELWDHVDTDVLQGIPKAMDPSIFWAGAKLWVQKHLQVPYTVIDTDAYFTQPVREFFEDYDLIASHRDDVNCKWTHFYSNKDSHFNPRYPTFSSLGFENHCFSSIDLSKFPAINVACLYIKDKKLQEEYIDIALEMISTCNKQDPDINLMLFVEQHILGYLILKSNSKTYFFTDDFYTPIPIDKLYEQSIWRPGLEQPHKKSNIKELFPVHIGPLRHMWIAKKLINCDQKFQSVMLTAIFKDMVEYFREYLDLDIVKSIAKKYEINPLTLI